MEKGWDPKFGGRPLRRAIQKELEDPLSLLVLEGAYAPGTLFKVEGKNGKITIKAPAGKGPEAGSLPVNKTGQFQDTHIEIPHIDTY
jgi:ATP-dependent Clp protease ATP-binding subunit ClpC